MESFSLFSNHVILPDYLQPVSAVIEVTGEFISNLTILSPNAFNSFSSLSTSIPNLIDLSDLFICPGLVDLNTRVEWDDFTTFSKSAISGGVTFALVEEPHFNLESKNFSEIYCDIGFTKIVNDENVDENFQGFFAVKCYLCEPCASVKPLRNLNLIHGIQERFGGSVFVDPNLPDMRMLYIASPHRYESIDEHVSTTVSVKSNIFTGAYNEDNVDSSSSEEEDEGTLPKRTCSMMENFNALFLEDIVVNKSAHSKGGDEIISIPERKESDESSPVKTHHKNYHYITHSATLFDDIDKKITENTQSLSAVCTAETHSYKFSHSSSYTSAAENSETEVLSEPKSPLEIVRKRPAKIITGFNEHNKNQEYCSFLANCPEHWETKGIEQVLSFLTPNSKIHFQGISSAAAINNIRHASESFKHLTCELPASHLFFTSHSIKNKDTRFKSNPPIRDSANLKLIRELVKLRCVQAITSQHVHINDYFKSTNSGNFHNALSGISSIGYTLQALWTSEYLSVGDTRAIGTLVRIFKWTSAQPAKIVDVGLRGPIKVGNLANLIVWDPFEKIRIRVPEGYEKINVYEGCDLYGKIFIVFLRGKIAFKHGEFWPFGMTVRPNNRPL